METMLAQSVQLTYCPLPRPPRSRSRNAVRSKYRLFVGRTAVAKVILHDRWPESVNVFGDQPGNLVPGLAALRPVTGIVEGAHPRRLRAGRALRPRELGIVQDGVKHYGGWGPPSGANPHSAGLGTATATPRPELQPQRERQRGR